MATTSTYALTVSGTATTKKALTATQNIPMAFAIIQAPTTGGTVTLSSAGVISSSTTGFAFSGSPTAANFTITGDASAALTVSFTNGTLSSSGATPYQGIVRFTGTGLSSVLDIITLTPLQSSVVLTGGGGSVTVSNFVPQKDEKK